MANEHDKSREELIETCQELRHRIGELQQAEAEQEKLISDLRLSERRLQALAESTTDCVWELNEDMEYSYVSPRVEDLLGYEPEELMGRTPFDFMPAREAKLAAEAFREFLQEGRLFTGYENHRWHKNGRLVAVETMGIPIYERENVRGFRGVDRNITARKNAQKQLRRAHKEMARRVENRTAELRAANVQLEEEIRDRREAQADLRQLSRRLNTLIEAVPDVLYFKDAEGRNLVVNRAYEEFFGVDSADVVGMKDEEFMTRELAEKCRESDRRALQSQEPIRVEEQWESPEGKTRWFETVKCRLEDDEGECQGLVGVSRDITERKRMEREVREKERRLSTLMDNLPGMAYRCRNERGWTMEFMSQGVEELTGYGPDKLVNSKDLSYADLIHPEDREEVWETVQRAVGDDAAFTLTYRIRCADGEERWVWEKGQATEKHGDGPATLEGFVTDITRRVRAEQALRESEKRSRALVEEMPLETIIIKADPLRFVYVNFGEGELLGYSAEELMQMSPEECANLVHPEDREMVQKRILDRMAGDRPARESYEVRMLARDGSIRWMKAYANKVTYAGEPAIQGLFVDMTEEKRTELELRKTRERFKKLVENSIQGMVVFRGHPPVVSYVNPGLGEILGYHQEELLEFSPDDVRDMVHPEDREKLYSRYEKRMAGEDVTSDYQARFIARDGSIKWLKVHAVGIECEGEKAALATYIDITEQKKREEELAHARRRLEGILDASETAVLAINPEMQVVAANQVLKRNRPNVNLEETPHCSDVLCGPVEADICPRCPVRQTFEDGNSHEILEIMNNGENDRMLRVVSVPGTALADNRNLAYAMVQEIDLPQ